MGLVYILVRTFPFWAIPLGLGLMGGWWTARKKKQSGKIHVFYLLLGTLLIAASIAFLALQGHTKAVPLAHEIFKGFQN